MSDPTGTPAPPRDLRVLVHTPTGCDGRLTCEVLQQSGHQCVLSHSLSELCDHIEAGAGLVMMAEEAFVGLDLTRLRRLFVEQPSWSDLQLVVFTKQSVEPGAFEMLLEGVTNITLLERPMRIASLRSVVATGLRSRDRQYHSRDLLLRLAELDRRKDEFLAMLGHELRNPLAAITSAVALLEHAGGGGLDRALPAMRRQTANLRRMVDDLLEVSRVLTGKIEIEREVVDLNVVAERSLSPLVETAIEHELTLKMTPWHEPVFVDADPVRLEQVLSNVLSNAIKYTPCGGQVTLRVERTAEAGVLKTTDTGIGLDADALKSIFEPFTQVDTSLHRAQGGLGLGLPLVSRLVKLHGGEVTASSEGPQTGSTFTVRLPLSEHDDVADDVAKEPESLGARRRVLVVDDDEDLRELLSMLVEGWGHHVQQCADGLSALRQVRLTPPDVALVDIGMPGMDGYDLARHIRADDRCRRVRLVALTGYGQASDREHAFEAGFDDHLVKPVDHETLALLLRS